jgi:glycosyltransferase involved in cell wall biosynthesis
VPVAPDPEPTTPDPATAAYVLERLAARRTVRAAVAAGRLRQGPAAVREAWRRPLALDDAGPPPGRLREPHLRVLHLTTDPLTAATAPGVRFDPASWRTQVEVQRPDLVLLDRPGVLTDPDELRRLRALHAAPVVATAEVARELGSGAPIDLVIDADDPEGCGAPAVDHRHVNPIDLPVHPSGTATWAPGRSLPAHAAVVVVPERGRNDRAALRAALHLAATGTVVVAAPTGAIGRAFGPHLQVAEGRDAEQVARDLAGDRDAWERASIRQRRDVLAHHTIDDRARQLLAAAGVRVRPSPRATVLLATRRPELVPAALAQVTGQRWDDLEVQLLLHGVDVDATDLDAAGRDLHVHRVPAELPLGAVLDVGLDAATGELIAKMDDDDLYGPGHLADLAVALRYSGADVVGRWANITHLADGDRTVDGQLDRQERWAHHLPGATMLVHGDVLRRLRWRHVPHGVDRELVRAVHADGGRVYSTHRFGFVRRRHGDHTFAQGDRTFARQGGRTAEGLDRTVLDV